jgi:quercetin dioxygenase-like cupin family protein
MRRLSRNADHLLPLRKDDSMAEHSYVRTHDLASEHLLIDLREALTELHGLAPDGQNRGAITLVKQGGLSVVLTHLHAGGVIAEHSAPGTTTVQVLDGQVNIQVGDDTLEVPAGGLIAFDARVRHSVEAIEDSTLLLTLAQAHS